MKRIVFVFIFTAGALFSVFCGGMTEKKLVNVQEIETDQIDSIEVSYGFEKITVYRVDSDTFTVKEYMTEDNSAWYAKITSSGNKLVVEAGRRPFLNGYLFTSFGASVEIYLPASNKNISIKTSSGSIEAAGVYAASSMSLECSSGSISLNSISAEKINLKTSSGSIYCKNADGNTTASSSSGGIRLDQVSGSLTASASSGSIRCGSVGGNAELRTNSGSMVFNSIGGNVSARSSSGRIELGTVNGTIDASASSGSIRCAAAENAGDISLITSSGTVVLDIPRNFVFNFSSRSSSGSLHTPFSDRLFIPLSDRNAVQGLIGADGSPETQSPKNIGIRTSSGSIRINWSN